MGGKTALAVVAAVGLSLAWSSPARAQEIGVGAVEGSVQYNWPSDLINQCDPLDWTLGAFAASVNILAASNETNGDGSIEGSGSTSCYRDGFDTGPVTLSASFNGATGLSTFTCPTLSGTYVRSGNTLSIDAVGTCSMNGTSLSGVAMSLTAATTGGDNALNTMFFAGAVTFSD